ncbi:MAG: hypothetical protein KBH85_08015 [Lachnospiraceae bacterium]|nr:hypothetical protein [Lachnospiraceae bacterium]
MLIATMMEMVVQGVSARKILGVDKNNYGQKHE